MFTLHILKFKLTGKLAVYKTVPATKLIFKLNLFSISSNEHTILRLMFVFILNS